MSGHGGPTTKGPLLSSLHLLDLEVFEALEKALDEALDDALDACEDVLNDAFEADLFSKANHHKLTHIRAIIFALSVKISKFVA